MDAVILTASTRSSEPVELAGRLARERGVVVVLGDVRVDVPRDLYYRKELQLRYSRSYGPGRYDPAYEERGADYPYGFVRWTENRNMRAYLDLVAAQKLRVQPLITHRFSVDNAKEGYDLLGGRRQEKYVGIVLTYPHAATASAVVRLQGQGAPPSSEQAGVGRFDRITALAPVEAVKTFGRTGVAHTFRCASSTRFASLADLKVCASRIFHSFVGERALRQAQGAERSRSVATPQSRESGVRGRNGVHAVRNVAGHDTNTVRIGWIGAGKFSRGKLLPAVQKLPNVTLMGLANSSGISARSAASDFGFRYCCTDALEVLNDPLIDAVFIGTRHDLHAALVSTALEGGKHVFVEKPLCINEAELEQISVAYGKAGRLLAVGYNRRFSPFARECLQFFDGREEPLSIIYRVNAAGVPRTHWLFDPDQGHGPIIGEVCHFVDSIQYHRVFCCGMGRGRRFG